MDNNKEEKENSNKEQEQEILEAIEKNNIHFGKAKKLLNPKMRHFIHGNLGRINTFDKKKILEKCLQLEEYLKPILENGEEILFFSSKEREALKEHAKRCEMPYMNKWKGGFLTNFKTIKKNIKNYLDLKKIIENEENFANFSKKNKAKLIKKFQKLSEVYEGLITNNEEEIKKPQNIFVLNAKKTVINEIFQDKNKIISICNSNFNPENFDFFIPGNNESQKSIVFFLNFFANTIIKIKKNI